MKKEKERKRERMKGRKKRRERDRRRGSRNVSAKLCRERSENERIVNITKR
jgi:hypothetical protein